MKRLVIATTILALLPGLAALEAQEADVVVLPFENLSGEDAAARELPLLIMGAFSSRGWRVASPEPIEDLLRAERVRYLDVLEGRARSRILEATRSGGVVTGTIYAYEDGPNPTVALSIRLVSPTGRLVWSNVAAVSSLETEGLLGFGRETTLYGVAVAAVEQLMEPLPPAGGPVRPTPGPRKSSRVKHTFYVAPEAMGSAPRLICVLPFVNESGDSNASRVVGDLFALRLAATEGLSIVEAGSLREAVLALGIPSFDWIRPEQMKALSERVGTPLFLRGTVYEYGRVGGRRGPPKMTIELVLEDLSTGRVVWVAQHEQRGSDYEGLFLRGAEVTDVGLADRMINELIRAAEDAFREGTRAQSAGLRPRSRSNLRGQPGPVVQVGGTR